MARAVAGTRGTLASLDARSTRVQPWPYNRGVASTKALCALRKEANLIPCLMPQVATRGGGALGRNLSQPKPCRRRRVQFVSFLAMSSHRFATSHDDAFVRKPRFAVSTAAGLQGKHKRARHREERLHAPLPGRLLRRHLSTQQ